MHKPVELTPEQVQQWGDTMSLMAWTCPGFRHLFYKLLSNNDGKYCAIPTLDIPTAATDAKNILINPEWFFKLALKERVFVIGHEIVHNVYGDVELLHRQKDVSNLTMNDGTMMPWDVGVMQKAMDYRINALLVDSKIGTMPKQGCYDPKIASANDSVLDVYQKIYEDEKGKDPGGFDIILSPGSSTGQSPQQAIQSRSAQQWAVEISAAQTLEAMRSQGRMAGALQRMFDAILNPKISWLDHIAALVARRVGSGSYDWKRPDRRFIVRDICMPGRSGHGAGWIVCWGDTSGSIGPDELCKYLGELTGIIEDVKPKRLTVIWCDAEIHRIDELEDGSDLQRLAHTGVGGGGGTEVEPVFDWIANNTEQPDMFIGFTDGHVSFPKDAPHYPIVWACVGGNTNFPWGDIVEVN